jgi:nicotinamidase-related amidase
VLPTNARGHPTHTGCGSWFRAVLACASVRALTGARLPPSDTDKNFRLMTINPRVRPLANRVRRTIAPHPYPVIPTESGHKSVVIRRRVVTGTARSGRQNATCRSSSGASWGRSLANDRRRTNQVSLPCVSPSVTSGSAIHSRAARAGPPSLVANIVALSGYRRPVVWVQHFDDEIIIPAGDRSGLCSTKLWRLLRGFLDPPGPLGLGRLVVVGAEADACIRSAWRVRPGTT